MIWPRVHFSLPLLGKELTEQAAKRRTYVLRSLYAACAFIAGYVAVITTTQYDPRNPFAVLGQGRLLFETLLKLEFAGIYLFLPAMTCGAITVEKERNTLGLLFLTRLRPSAILMEKLLGRLLPMLMTLLLLLPLLAFTYSLGGVATSDVWAGMWIVFVTAFQVAALSLMCSAWSRTTVGAFLGSYLLMVALFAVAYGPSVLKDAYAVGGPGPATTAFFSSMPILLSGAICLLLARVFLIRRAYVPNKKRLLKFFSWLDQTFHKWNDRYARGIILVKENPSQHLPEFAPVSWRETTKTILGAFRYLFRMVIAIEIPLMFVLAMLSGQSVRSMSTAVDVLLNLAWMIAALLISVKSASLIASERVRETLDVLLVTPMTSQNIVDQKLRGVRRLMGAASIPIITLICWQSFWFMTTSQPMYSSTFRRFIGSETGYWFFLFSSLVAICVYMPFICNVGLYVGLRARTQTRAAIVTIAVLFAICLSPLILIPLDIAWAVVAQVSIGAPLASGSHLSGFGAIFSPLLLFLIDTSPYYQLLPVNPWLAVIANGAFFSIATRFLRARCLKRSDELLGRASGDINPVIDVFENDMQSALEAQRSAV